MLLTSWTKLYLIKLSNLLSYMLNCTDRFFFFREYLYQWRVFSILSPQKKKASKFNLILENWVQWGISTIQLNAHTWQSLSSLQSLANLKVVWQTYTCRSDGSFGVSDWIDEIKIFTVNNILRWGTGYISTTKRSLRTVY